MLCLLEKNIIFLSDKSLVKLIISIFDLSYNKNNFIDLQSTSKILANLCLQLIRIEENSKKNEGLFITEFINTIKTRKYLPPMQVIYYKKIEFY